MKISKYGIVLERLRSPEDQELVREKRNSSVVKRGMFFQETITPEMQQTWFQSQYNRNNYHFIISYNGEKVGLISGKKVDFEKGSSEGGIFIWEEKFLGTPVPVIASVIMAEMTFNLLGLRETFAESRLDNKASLSYNKLLGYEIMETIESEGKVKLRLSRHNFQNKGARFVEVVRKMTGSDSGLEWKDISFDNYSSQEIDSLYKGFPPVIQENIDSRIS